MQPDHPCYAEKCKATVTEGHLFCAYHWGRVPSSIQWKLADTYKPGRRVSEKLKDAVKSAIDAIAVVEELERRIG